MTEPPLAAQSRDPHLTLRRVERQQRIVELLSTVPVRWATEDLAARLGVSPRTVERDLARLRESGVPIESRRGPGGGARLAAARAEVTVTLTAREVAALIACLAALGPTATDSAGSAMTVLVGALTDSP